MSNPATDVVNQGLVADENHEVWQMNLDSILYLEILATDRFGNRQGKELKIGPHRKGYQFLLSKDDRLDNQRRVAEPSLDPFRNGTLTRVDADQRTDPNTASSMAVTDQEILDIIDLPQVELEARVSGLNEVVVRRILAVATAMDISHQKITFLEAYVKDSYARGAPQKSLTSNEGERLP